METIPNLALPSRAPSIAGLLTESMELRPVALYTLAPLSDTELAELHTACERDTSQAQPGANIRLAPQPRFVGEDLRTVFEYHLQIITENVFDPLYFLVAVERQWERRGILIVALDNGELECKVDKLYSLAPAAGLSVVNLQIGNLEWSDLKEDGLPLPGRSGDSDEDNDDTKDDDNDNNNNDDNDDKKDDDNDNNNNDDNGTGSNGGNDAPTDDDNDGPPIPKGPPPAGSYCGIYGVEGTDAESVVHNLVPGAKTWKDRSQWPVLFQGILSPSKNPIDQAFALHPSRCRRNKWLYADLFFLADNLDPAENGIFLCQLSTKRVQRSPLNALEGLQQLYFPIKMGTRPWVPPVPLFIVFRDGFDKTIPIHLLSKNGGEFFTPLNHDASTGKRLQFNKLEEALRWFPVFCRRLRFRSNLQKNHFICIPEDWGSGVLLVHVDWDADLSRPRDELRALDLSTKIRSLQVPIEKACITLRGVIALK